MYFIPRTEYIYYLIYFAIDYKNNFFNTKKKLDPKRQKNNLYINYTYGIQLFINLCNSPSIFLLSPTSSKITNTINIIDFRIVYPVIFRANRNTFHFRKKIIKK